MLAKDDEVRYAEVRTITSYVPYLFYGVRSCTPHGRSGHP